MAEVTQADMSWIDISICRNAEVIADYAPGWADVLDEHFLQDCIDIRDTVLPDDVGTYRWTGYTIGSWEEGDQAVVYGGTFARHRTEAVKPLVDTNQRARAILSERSGAAYQFDWDIQVISLVAAEKAITSAREEALREAAEVFGPVFQYLREAHRTSVDAPGHMHAAPGIWDDGNGSKSGTACEWCATWDRAVDYLSLITGGGGRG